jgi:hypothetical protein
VQNGEVLELDDIVQCKSCGVYCIGRIVRVNYDGTYNTLYGIFNYSQTAAGATGTLNGTITLMATKIA